MQTTFRSHEQPDPRSFAARKGHLPQLSISDDNHHVTEAIGYMYGEDDSPSSPQSSTRSSVRSDRSIDGRIEVIGRRNSFPRKPVSERKVSNGDRYPSALQPQSKSPINYRNGWGEKNLISPTSSSGTRDASPSDTASTQFPLNDIDYESSPAAVAQELSNLQALRRMSMDLGSAGDPDLPPINPAALPSAPSPTASEDDAARLFWVPARLHPELAPKEFKSFLESKAEQIKRRSGELSAFSQEIPSKSNSLSSNDAQSGLRRKKSMLSRQINNPVGYQDGADRLERIRSEESYVGPEDPKLQDLESLMASGARRFSQEDKSDEQADDMILPSVPGSTLKRSTRTKYHRPNSRKGLSDQNTYAERVKRRAAGGGPVDNNVPVPTINIVPNDSIGGFSTDSNLDLTLKDPSSEPQRSKTNFSRPGGRSPSPPKEQTVEQSSSVNSGLPRKDNIQLSEQSVQRTAKRTPDLPPDRSVPQIVEPSLAEDHPVRTSSMVPPPTKIYPVQPDTPKQDDPVAPKEQRPKSAPPQRPGLPSKQSNPLLSSTRPSSRGTGMPPQTKPSQSLEQPSPLPGHDTNTSNLSFIPTLTVDKRQEQRRKEEKKSGWGWLLGKDESDKEKEKTKTKGGKASTNHDTTRIDVLQNSIDGNVKGRESLVLDRDSLKLEEERKKESQRKSTGSEKKEKESIFSSIFGGKKHRAEKEAQRRAQERLSPEPPYRELKPDIDYNWTRFSILEERTIYRMAHIKLANPRRALYSQVLLSNFMYSYLAKVQQMHPQMNLPTSAKQQRKQKEQQLLQQQQQPDEYTQYQRYQQQQAQQAASSHGSDDQIGTRPSLDNDSNVFDFNYSREKPQSDARSSQQSMESDASSASGGEQYVGNGISYPAGGGGSLPQLQQHQQQQQSRPQRQNPQQRVPGGYKYDDDDDEDDDMW